MGEAPLAQRHEERFLLHRVLGEGSTGVVHEATDRVLGRRVALKQLRSAGATHNLFLKNEFRILSEIYHPNLVELYELHARDEAVFFSMEFLRGEDVVAFVGTAPQASDDRANRARGVLAQLAGGLACLHAAGKLHRDVKPSNVLVTPEGRVVLLDFGLAATTNPADRDPEDEGMVGSLAYLAPEQIWGAPPTPASDWYSVGVTLYEALTGRLPFNDTAAAQLRQKERGPTLVWPAGIPADLQQLIAGLLDPDPQQRAGAAEVAAVAGSVTDVGWTRSAFVGRQRELAALSTALGKVRAGAPLVVELSGPSGIGKSELLRAFQARARGRLVLHGRCHPRESVPYKALDGVMDSLSRELLRLGEDELLGLETPGLRALMRVFPVLARVPALEAGAAPLLDERPDTVRREARRALRHVLGTLASRHGVVLTIDDLQWGDLDSVELLLGLLSGESPPGLLVVLAFRSEEREQSPPLRAFRLGRSQSKLRVEEHALGPLDEAESLELARQWLNGEEESRIRKIALEGAGSPFFVGELARYQRDGGAHDGHALSLGEAIRARFDGLQETPRTILEILSISGRLRADVLLAAAELEISDRPLLFRLQRQSLIRSTLSEQTEFLETYHDQIRECVASALATPRRSSLHGRVAASLEQLEVPDHEALAEHHRGAGNRVRATECFSLAADEAGKVLAFKRTAALLEQALELDPEGLDQVRLRDRLATAYALGGRSDLAAGAYESAAEVCERLPGPQRPALLSVQELRRKAAEQWLRAGDIEHGLGGLRSVLRQLGVRYPATAPGAIGHLLYNRVRLRVSNYRFRVSRDEDPRSTALGRIDACWSATLGLNLIDILRSAYFQSVHSVLAIRAGEPNRLVRALTLEMVYLANEGGASNRARSADLLKRAEALAEDHADRNALGFLHLCAGAADFFMGRWTSALQRLAQGEEIFRARTDGVIWETTNCHMYSVWALSALGHLERLVELQTAAASSARQRNDVIAEMALSSERAVLAPLVLDDPARARRQSARAAGRFPARPFQSPHYFDFYAQVHVDLYEGRGLDAWRRLRDAWPKLKRIMFLRMQFFRVELHCLRGRCALAAATHPGLDDRDRSRLIRKVRESVKVLKREDLPHAPACARLLEACSPQPGAEGVDTEALLLAAAELDALGLRLLAWGAEFQAGAPRSRIWARSQGIRRPTHFARVFAPVP